MRDQVQLIAYADRLGGSLAGLHRLLDGPLAGLFGGVHVLPFYRPFDGADAGFDPQDHLEVDPRLGGWDDVAALGRGYDTTADVVVNHASSRSPQFTDLVAEGDASPHAGMFLTYGRVFPSGATEADLLRVYRPRPGLPFTPFTLAGGERRLFWTTFTGEQVDLDVEDPKARAYLAAVLERLAAAGIAMVRLDAAGYAVKRAGTSCFLLPETVAFLAELTAQARALGLQVLLELHTHHRHQLALARGVDRVYDFALPPLVLHGLTTGDAGPLRRWLAIRPDNAVTVLDTHDGIGVVDVGADASEPQFAGLLGPREIDALVRAIEDNSGGTSALATGAAASNVDLYQVNCTYYDALARDDRRYLLARLLQFLLPGVPQVYYVGLLAGTNDVDLLRRTGVGRDVNRHHYTPDEVVEALQRPVVRALTRLIRFRNTHPAFSGTFDAGPLDAPGLSLTWRAGPQFIRLDADLAAPSYRLGFSTPQGERTVSDVADLPDPTGWPGSSR